MRQDRIVLVGGVCAAVILAGLAGFGLAKVTASSGEPPRPAAEATPAAAAGKLRIAPEVLRGAGIQVEGVEAGGLAQEVLAPATVAPAPGGAALVTARAAGAVTRLAVRLGDPVAAGQVLAVVESREAAQIAADRAAALAKAALAQKVLARERALFEQRVSPRVDYEQAEAQADVAAAEVRRAQVAAGAAKVTADGRGVAVVSPISGRVTAMTASLGAYVQPEAELFRIADPRQVQVEAALSAADAGRVRPGDRARLELADGGVRDASVRSVTPALDAESRTATAVLDAPGLQLAPGQTARVRIYPRGGDAASGAPPGVVVAPQEAIQSVEGHDVVFVLTVDGFQTRQVRLGRASAGRVEILAGLSPGERVATRNAFLLKADLGKGEGEE